MRLLNEQVPPRHPHPRSQQGITLIELMIALVIGLLATGAMLKVYVDSSRLYRFNESLARIQENGRFGLEFIRRDARMAGFWGCNHEVNLTNHATDHPSFKSSDITGTNGSGNEPDSITFLGAGRNVGTLSLNMAEIDGDLNVYSTDDLEDVEGPVLISDCESADIFEATGTEGNVLEHDTGLSKLYAKGSSLYSVQMVTYCITRGTNSAQLSLHRLVKQTNDQNCATDGDDLVEGIENMQILMGEDTNADPEGADGDGTANRYVHPGYKDSVTGDLDDDRIVSTRISLLAVSPYNNVTTERAPYFFNGALVGAEDMSTDDRYLRKEFTTTVALRNKTRIRTEGDDEDVVPADGTLWADLTDAQRATNPPGCCHGQGGMGSICKDGRHTGGEFDGKRGSVWVVGTACGATVACLQGGGVGTSEEVQAMATYQAEHGNCGAAGSTDHAACLGVWPSGDFGKARRLGTECAASVAADPNRE